jgi:hypothetical protein
LVISALGNTHCDAVCSLQEVMIWFLMSRKVFILF